MREVWQPRGVGVKTELGGFRSAVQREGGERFAGVRPVIALSDVTDGMNVSGVT